VTDRLSSYAELAEILEILPVLLREGRRSRRLTPTGSWSATRQPTISPLSPPEMTPGRPPMNDDQTAGDLRRPFAEALAQAFTRPMPKLVKGRPTDEIADPHPGDRVDRTMSVQFTAPDGYPSFRMVTCMEAAEVCAAVRDEEMAALRQEVEQLRVAASPLKAAAAGRLVASATSLVRIERNDARQRADRAEAHALRLRQAVTILRAALRHDTPCNGPSPDVDPCGACVAIEYLAGAAIDEPEIEGEPQETRNPGERPSERLPGPLHSPTGPRKDSLPEAALDEPEAHHE
jgi:hypothetical protein